MEAKAEQSSSDAIQIQEEEKRGRERGSKRGGQQDEGNIRNTVTNRKSL